jgi:hypothetical protein
MENIGAYIGYLASVFLIISLSISGDLKLRIFNSLGCLCFIVYGFIFNAWPVILTNAILLVINLFYIRKLYQHKENFELVEVKADDGILSKFLEFYKDDIASFYPQFNKQQLNENINFIVLRDLTVANVFSVKLDANNDALISINYTIKKYRDFKISKFIFSQKIKTLAQKGIKRILHSNENAHKYQKYFDVLHFKTDGKYFIKEL